MNGQTLFNRLPTLLLLLLLLLALLLPAACAPGATETASQTAATATEPSSLAVVTPPATITSPPPTETAAPPTVTATLTPTPPAATPTPTSTTPPPTPIAGTLLFYTTAAAVQTTPDQPAQRYWALRSLPPLPGLAAAEFDTLYGPYELMEDFSMFLANARPQLAPDGRFLLVPGLHSYPEYDVIGTGTWLIDLQTGAARQLLPDGVVATWNSGSDAITYVEAGTLYTLSIAEGAMPQPLFQHELWPQYAKWSPDGRWIAAVSSVQNESTGDVTFTYWLVPPDGGPAREFASRVSGVGEFNATEVSWSPDGQYLLAHNLVYDMQGNQLLPTETGGLTWLPDRSQLLYRVNGLSVLTVTGEEVVFVNQSDHTSAKEWAIAQDGRRLAFTMPRTDEGIAIALSNLESGETQMADIIPGALYIMELRWSGDDALLIAGADHGEARYDIWTLPTAPNSTAERLIADAILIEAVPSP